MDSTNGHGREPETYRIVGSATNRPRNPPPFRPDETSGQPPTSPPPPSTPPRTRPSPRAAAPMSPVVTSVELGSLTLGRPVGSGGQGEVFELASDPSKLVKLYNGSVKAAREPLDASIRWAQNLDAGDRALLDASTSWPQQLVEDQGTVAGVVIPRAPNDFYLQDKTGTRLAELSFLIAARRSVRLGHALPDARTRFAILRSFAEVVDLLHRGGFSHGDISFKNVLWSTRLSCAYLLDCDGVRHDQLGAALPHVVTTNWVDPRLIDGEIAAPDMHSDRRAFALAVYRSTFGENAAAPEDNPDFAIPPQPRTTTRVQGLICHGVLTRDERPGLDTWVEALDELLGDPDPLGEAPAFAIPFDVPSPVPDLVVVARPSRMRPWLVAAVLLLLIAAVVITVIAQGG